MKEYGSNIQKLVSNIVNIDDREKRTRYAHILVELMRQIHPNMRDGQDYYNKLWDDLYIISGWKLDVDSPYPPPSPEVLGKKPQRVPYNTHNLRFKHFGFNLGLLVDKAISIEDPDEKRAFVSYLVRLMRTFYATWAKENVEDEAIFQSLIELSKGRLREDVALIRTSGLVEGTPRERTGDQPQRLNNQPQRQGGQTTRSYPNNGGQQYGGNRNDRGDGTRNNQRTNNRDGDASSRRDGGQGGLGQNARNNNPNGRNDGSGQRGPGNQPRNAGNGGSGFRPNNNRDGGPRDGGQRDGGDGSSRPRDNNPRRRR